MERRMGFWFKPILVVLLLAALALAGCEGDDGDRGPQGLQGPQGEQGEQGVPGTPAVETALQELQQPEVTINSVSVDDTDPANPVMQITFTPSADTIDTYQASGGGILAENPDRAGRLEWLRISYARLTDTPANGVGAQWLRYEHHGYDVEDFTDNGDGTITFAKTFSGDDYDASKTTRVLIQVYGIDNVTAPLNVTQDFVPNGGAVVSREIVSEEACNSCHGNLGGGANGISGVHGGSRYLVAACDVCHADRANSASGSDGISVGRELIYMIHAIHSEADLADDPDVIRGRDDWDHVSYPENIKNCTKCHTDDAADADNYLIPSALACTGCHVETTFTGDSPTHSGGAQPDTACVFCHPATGTSSVGGSVTAVHDTTLTGKDASEFTVNIALSEDANADGVYEVGETPTVTVTLIDNSTGLEVDPGVYTANQDGEGTGLDGSTYEDHGLAAGLSTAELFVYGPRNEAVPVMTTGSTTDPTFDPLTDTAVQGHSLFLNEIDGEVLGDGIGNDDGVCEFGEACTFAANPDPQVSTSATGYSYDLLEVTEDMEPGTYMIRIEAADFGGTNAEYVTSSSGLITFQVGTATEEPKVSGDACLNCHGDNIMHLTGAHAHHVPFDTDYCLACHDKSGNYGDYIGNRVHAVHRGSVTGDAHNRDWFEVAFPQEPNNCTICHTNPDAETPVWRMPQMLVCGGCHGIMPDADPENPDYYTDLDPSVGDDAETIAEKMEQIRTEVAAAQHMEQNGGDAEAEAAGDPGTLACLTCHGEDRIADLFVTHKLITFPPPVEED